MNKTFEEKKKECFKELKKYSKELADFSADPDSKVLLDVLLKPTNDKDLECINAYILYQTSLRKIFENIIFSHYDVDDNDNLFQRWFSEIATAISKNEDLKTIQEISNRYHLENPWNYAEYTLGFSISLLNNSKITEIISSIFKPQNADEMRKYASSVLEYQSKLSIPNPMFLKSRNADEIDKFIEHTNCFSSIVDEKFKSKDK